MKRDSIAEALRREILSANFPPGMALRQQDIAAQLGVSPTPVREAFRMLEADGYVQSHAHRGTVVAQRDYQEVIDAHEIRFALESLAARRIVARKDPAALAQVRDTTKAAARAMRTGGADGFRLASVAFHHALIEATGSVLLRHLIERLVAYWFLFPQDRHRMVAAHREHVAILEALTRGEAEEAIRVLGAHLDAQITLLTDLSRKAAATSSDVATPRPARSAPAARARPSPSPRARSASPSK
jgi:DNA-binding GntR family transcriptional regulator